MNFQTIYEAIIESNAINFIIVFYFLTFIFKKFKLGAMIDNICDEIKNNVNLSYETLSKASKNLEEAKDDAKKIPVEKEKIINNAKQTVEKLTEKTNVEIENKKNSMDSDLDKVKDALLNFEFQKTTKNTQELIYKISKKTIKNMLNNEIQRKIIFDSLHEIDNFSIKEGEL